MAVIEALQNLSVLFAIAIIVVGVGDGPWEEMEHYGAMLPKRKFENFHFVNLGQVMADNFEQPALGFATAALAHIPDQLAAIRRLGLLHEGHSDTNSQKTTASKHE
ncbi:unnamed protein product [Phytophthora lilii]|uniref:Unnamed protein product n=1 Tax=Phytophthora lilii TaxID=2077276 RepID=A0A9W6TF52_9STRA|nr:unnamed protein product [Phytophthora lilii]